MSISTQRGHVAWSVQAAKIAGGTFTPADYTWQKHRVESADIGIQEFNDALPPEVGGTLFVSTTFKNGAFVGGQMNLYQRMQKSIGHLLFAAAGAKAATAGTGTAATRNRFYPNPADESFLQWLALRKYIPATVAASGLTEYFYDCRVATLALNIPAMGASSMQVGILGRKPKSADNESTLGDAYEDGTGIGLSCRGSVSLPGFVTAIGGGWNGKFTSAQVLLANNISTPQSEMVIGDFHPDDFTTLSRAATVQLIYKWEDPKLYKELFNDGTAGDWSPVIGTSAVRIKTASANNIPTKSVPYSIEFGADNVDWTMSTPVLAGANLLQTQLTGVVKGTLDGVSPTWWIDLINDASYAGLGA